MKLRQYVAYHDADQVCEWLKDERVHAMWSANRFPYPLTRANLNEVLSKHQKERKEEAFVVTKNDGEMVGFFCYSLDSQNIGLLRFLVISPSYRGHGYGKQMVQLALNYAKDCSKADAVRINVFDRNLVAFHLYTKMGFVKESETLNALQFYDESWNRLTLLYQFHPATALEGNLIEINYNQ